MAFSDYKYIGQTQAEFGIKFHRQNFISARAVEPAADFVRELKFTFENFPYRSEPSRAEALIFPILREVYKLHSDKFTLWSHEPIRFDDRLSGAPNYLIATKSPLGITVLAKPLLAVVEAKKNDFEFGWGQCLAELVAVQKLNGNDEQVVYGIVTDGILWQFGNLKLDLFTQNTDDFTTTNLPELFGAVHFIFQMSAVNI